MWRHACLSWRKDALGQVATAFEGVSDFTVAGVAAALRGLVKGGMTRKDVFKTVGGVFNPNLVRVTTPRLWPSWCRPRARKKPWQA